MKRKQLREIIRKVVKEMSASGGGVAGAGMSAGPGEQTASAFAFNPNKKAKGTSSNYYLKMGWKPVNKKK
jgi:hypothetical protein